MRMQAVNSNNIESIGYENGTLYVNFYKGGLYTYSNVPESLYVNLLHAGSCGEYFASNIKGKYPYQHIG